MNARSISVLGATGSVGGSTLDLVAHGEGRFAVDTLTAHRDAARLARLARAHRARHAVIADDACLGELRELLAGTGIGVAAGAQALCEAAERPVDLVMAAIVGVAGLAPTLAAIRTQRIVALANKETLVCAGALMMGEARRCGATLISVDSEHSALAQALGGAQFLANPDFRDVEDLIITASGGPFRALPAHELKRVTPEQALAHPVWSMGAKISIDSATLMNKALELIEARHLFAVSPGQLKVLVHPQSIVHGLVRYRDGSVVAQMAQPDMRIPISQALAWPGRIETPAVKLDLAAIGTLTFEPPDEIRFPALRLARQMLADDGGAAAIVNAANEYAVSEFLAGNIAFPDIVDTCNATLDAMSGSEIAAPASLEDALDIDAQARRIAAARAAQSHRRSA